MTKQKGLDEIPPDEEFEKGIEDFLEKVKDNLKEVPERDVRVQLIEQIKSLVNELKLPITRLETMVENKYKAKIEDLRIEELQKVVQYLEKKRRGMEAKKEVPEVEFILIQQSQDQRRGMEAKKEVPEEEVKEPKIEVLKEKGLQDVEERLGKEGKEVEGEEKDKWDHRVTTDEGTFLFRFEDREEGVLICKNEANGTEYEIVLTEPSCTCPDYQLRKKELSEYCKHLSAAKVAGYDVKELPELPAVPEKKRERKKAKIGAEVVELVIMEKKIELPMQVPEEIIKNEMQAVNLIQDILGPNPRFGDVVEKYGNIEEISADVIISMSQYLGIQTLPLVIEEEKTRINIGKIFMAVADEEQRKKYQRVADMMPDVELVTRCRITSVAGWRDKSGDPHIGVGTKEEVLTPFELADIAKRGASFIRTKAETKSAKKAILNCLPITHDGLLQKIKAIYHWD
jgi:hypothetical protein